MRFSVSYETMWLTKRIYSVYLSTTQINYGHTR
jgi:hypothetical protein